MGGLQKPNCFSLIVAGREDQVEFHPLFAWAALSHLAFTNAGWDEQLPGYRTGPYELGEKGEKVKTMDRVYFLFKSLSLFCNSKGI